MKEFFIRLRHWLIKKLGGFTEQYAPVHTRVISIYAQPERNERKGIIPNALQKEFAQRYVYGRCYLRESWTEYLKRHKEGRLHT